MNAASVSAAAHSASEAGVHRFAIAGVVCSMAGVLSGAMVISSGGTSFLELHHITAGIAALAVVILGIWMTAGESRRLGIILLGLTAAEALLGLATDSVTAGIIHACIAPLIFACCWAAMVETSPAWKTPPEEVYDHGWPSLRSLGKITPVFVLFQIFLGACFRHKALGVLPHLFMAMVLILLILCVCIFVMQQFPNHKALRPASNQLMAIAFTQIFLGIAAFTVRSMNTKATDVVIGVTAAHALVGAITLGAAVILAMQIQRNVLKKVEEAE